MPQNIQKKTAATRKQNKKDNKTVFGFDNGRIDAYTIPEEVELTRELFTEYKSSNEYKNLLKVLPDIELTDIEKKDDWF